MSTGDAVALVFFLVVVTGGAVLTTRGLHFLNSGGIRLAVVGLSVMVGPIILAITGLPPLLWLAVLGWGIGVGLVMWFYGPELSLTLRDPTVQQMLGSLAAVVAGAGLLSLMDQIGFDSDMLVVGVILLAGGMISMGVTVRNIFREE